MAFTPTQLTEGPSPSNVVFPTLPGCSIPDVTDNVCGEETCTPGPEGYTCGERTKARRALYETNQAHLPREDSALDELILSDTHEFKANTSCRSSTFWNSYYLVPFAGRHLAWIDISRYNVLNVSC